MDLETYVQRANVAELEIQALSDQLAALLQQNPDPSANGTQVPEELEKLRIENSKLKYRLGILQRATAEVTKGKTKVKMVYDCKKNMLSLVRKLEEVFGEAITKAFPDLPEAPCPVTPSAKFGDYQFNGAMAISGLLKGTEIVAVCLLFIQPVPSKIAEMFHF